MTDSSPPAKKSKDSDLPSSAAPRPELLHMPDLVIGKIAGFSGLRGVVQMGRVCSRFYKLLDEQPPNIALQCISIHENRACIMAEYRGHDKKSRTGMHYSKNTKRDEDGNEDPKETCLKDFGKVLRLQNSVMEWVKIVGDDVLLKRIASILEARVHPLKAQKLHITARSIKDAMSILQNFCSKSLKSVIFEFHKDHPPLSDDQMSQLASLDHWKSIKSIRVRRAPFENPLDNLYHFIDKSEMEFYVEELRFAYFVALKEMILGPDFKSLSFHFKPSWNHEEFKAIMGSNSFGAFQFDPMHRETLWYFEAPNGNGVLRAKLRHNFVEMRIIEQDEFPEGTIAQPMFQFPVI